MVSSKGSTCTTPDDDTDASKTTSRSVSSDFAAPYSYYSRETSELKVNMKSHPSSAGNNRHSEKKMCGSGKKTWKRVDKRRMSKHLQKLNHEFSRRLEKGCNGLDGSRKEFNQDTSGSGTISQGTRHKGTGSMKKRLNARSYRKWLSSLASKARVSNMLGKRDRIPQRGSGFTRANASDAVEKMPAENCSSCPRKRQRLGFDTEQQGCFCSATPVHGMDDFSLPKDGRESMSRINMELSKEEMHDARGKKTQLEVKIDGGHDACAICMLGGELLCCEGNGCQRTYHLSCLDPPFNAVPPGVWHCMYCVKKKIELGVHSVSKCLESIWEVREVVLDDEGMLRQKEYFVKYQGLSHVHNQWIPEKKLLLEAPKLAAKFNKKNKLIKWKAEWAVPQRLLEKRPLLLGKCEDEYCHGHSEINLDLCYEWLVKWTSLDYDQATWELQNDLFLLSPEAVKLKRDYEVRHGGTERIVSQADEAQNSDFSKSSELSTECSPGAYSRYQCYVDKLHELWHKGQNAIVVDDHGDQERVVKLILFMVSLQHVLKPFLIITSPDALLVWELEFLHVAPSANLVVYKANKYIRSSIRSLEFYNEVGQIMFQVLLSSSSVVVEDLEELKCIQWKAVIIDDCQRCRVSRHFKEFKMLAADTRLLLVSTQIKDCSTDYLNLVSLLDSGPYPLNSGDTEIHSSNTINNLKERLAPYIVYECKSGSFRFEEFWVPVRLSNVQLEQYCAKLLSNSTLLRSSLKNDQTDALREIMISTRKCCDHPYLLDQCLQSIVRNDLAAEECLDAEIQVSGKLLLLDKILLKVKDQGLRALIMFQSVGGSVRDSVGDILEDYVRQRFGNDCYVRIDGGVYARGKKLAALTMFNEKDSEKFVFLIENRACLPSIKLSSVDIVILFDSDWDPQSDLRALNKITINSQFEQLKVFRLYSSCTIEEKVLILAKESAAVDNSINYVNRNASALLSWGASYLFNKLDDFHGCKKLVSGSNMFSEQSFLDDVLCELSAQLPSSTKNSNPDSYSLISKVGNNGAYKKNILLVGEKEISLMDSKSEPSFFWKNLLKGTHPQWHFLSESSQRIRRPVQHVDNLPEESRFGNIFVKKRWEVRNNQVDPIYLKSKLKQKRELLGADEKFKAADRNGDSNQVNGSPALQSATDDITRVPELGMIEPEEQNKLPSLWENTASWLKQEITQLCDILEFPENVKDTAMMFLVFIMKDYNVSWETESTLQAFQISLCWAVASFLDHKIDHKESLVLAKLQRKFDCNEDEANYIFSELHSIKKEFDCHLETAENSKPTTTDQQDMKGGMQMISEHAKNLKSATSDLLDLEEAELPGGVHGQNNLNQLMDLEEGEIPITLNDVKFPKSTMTDQKNLEGGELPVDFRNQQFLSDQPIELEEGEIPMSSDHVNNSRSTNDEKFPKSTMTELQNLEGGELPVDFQNQSLSDQLIELVGEGVIPMSSDHVNSSRSTTFEQLDLGEREIATGSQNQSLSDKLEDLEEGEIPVDFQNQSLSDQPIELVGEGVIPMSSDHVNSSRSTTFEQLDLGEREIATGSLNQSLSDKLEDLEEGEIPCGLQSLNLVGEPVAMPQQHCSGILDKNIKDKIDDSNSRMKLQKENLMSSQAATSFIEEQHMINKIVQLGKIAEKPDSELKVDETQPSDIVIVHDDSQNATPENIPSLSTHNPYGTVPAMPLKVFDISVNEKEIHTLPVGAVTITIESDTESDGEEAIVSESVPATCCMQNDVVNDSVYGAPILSLIENQNAAINVQSIGSVMQPSEASQTQLHEVILVDDTSRSAAHDMATQKDSLNYSLNLVRANASEVDQSGRAVPFICEESLNMKCYGTSSSLVQQDINTLQGNSFPVQQMPVSAVASIARNGLPGLEIPCYQSDVRHATSAEAHISQRSLSAAQVELFDPDVRDLGYQPLSSMYVGGNGTHVQDLRRRNDFLDFRSAATVSGSLNNRPLHDNPVAHEFPLPACADPLQAEMLKIEKGLRDDLERHEVLISLIKSRREKELEEVSKKYDTLLQAAERIFQQKRKDLLTNLNKVYANKLLAEAVSLSFRQATGFHANQFIQQAAQQTLQVPALRLGQCVTSPLVTSSVEVISRSPAVHSTSNVVPCTRPMTFSPINLQNGSVLRAPASHLQASRSYSSTWTSDFPIAHHGMPLSYNSLASESGHGSLVDSQNRNWGNQGHVNSSN